MHKSHSSGHSGIQMAPIRVSEVRGHIRGSAPVPVAATPETPLSSVTPSTSGINQHRHYPTAYQPGGAQGGIGGPSNGASGFITTGGGGNGGGSSVSGSYRPGAGSMQHTTQYSSATRSQGSSGGGGAFGEDQGSEDTRPGKEHKFLTEVNEVRQMESGLLGLLEDFHSGRLQAFGRHDYFTKMDRVREQQERLARLHFDLDSQQQERQGNSAPTAQGQQKRRDTTVGAEGGPEVAAAADESQSNCVSRLMVDLEGLSQAIQALKKDDSPKRGAAAGAGVSGWVGEEKKGGGGVKASMKSSKSTGGIRRAHRRK